ncbi:MAG: hypothetical protein ACOCXQ_01370 [Patescibacteria group bacterium]
MAELEYKLYATYKTHKFLKSIDIESILVQKISTPNLKPNLLDLLDAHRFDLIINIPTGNEKKEKETTDGQVIRQKAVVNNIPLVTEVSVAKDLVGKLAAART